MNTLLMVNLGCGTNLLPPPWKNYDAELDITKPLPFDDESVDFILIEHCLEHVDSAAGMNFLLSAWRCLKPNGVLRICVPELRRMSNFKRFDLCVNHGHKMVYCFDNLSLMIQAAGFTRCNTTERKQIDGHWKVIGIEEDNRETLRVEAFKT